MTYALWIVQGLLAALFLFAGGAKLVLPLDQMTGPVALPGWFLRFLGVAEVLGALGLILPGLLRIRPGLTPLAAAGLVIIMIGATVITLVGGMVAVALMNLVVALRGVRRLRPLAAGAAARIVSPLSAPAGQLISMRRRVTMLIKILIALAVVVVVFLAIVATRPAEYRVARTATISAPAPAVFAQVNDFHKWEAWNPWAKLDPAMKQTYEGAPAGTGAIYTWTGNTQVGEGRMTLTESRPNELIRINLEFLKPFAATSTAEFTFRPEGNQTIVTWRMAGKNNFMAKAVHLFMDMDKMIGGMFERGLAQMKSVVEAKG